MKFINFESYSARMRIKKPKKGYEKLTEEKARIVAHLIGDGAHYKTNHDYVMKYEVRDEELLNQFSEDLFKVYGLKVSKHANKSGFTDKPIYFVRLRSKLVFEDLAGYATYFSKDWRVKDQILNADLLIRREFLRAIYDDEGSVKSKYEIALYSINREGLEQIKEMLKEFHIDSCIKSGFGANRRVYGLMVKDFISFNDKIGFNLRRKRDKLRGIIKSHL